MSQRAKTGKTGEAIAAGFLKNKGYQLVARNYKKLGGEIDIIARNNEVIKLVEVKSKSSAAKFFPEQNLSKKKFENIVNTYKHFIFENPEYESLDPHIDVIIVEVSNSPKVKHFENLIIE